MRGHALLLTGLMLLAGLAGCFGEETKAAPEPEPLRLNDLRMKGTHNSYHVATPGVATLQPEYNYTHTDLHVQADRLGVRQFELDVYLVPGMGLRVYHTPWDLATNCEGFIGCMTELRNWSDANPDHAPLWIFVEPKDLPDVVEEFDILEEIETEIASTWTADRRITPAEVQGDADSLREAVTTTGWPTLEESRGKVLFVLLDKTEIRDLYLERNPTLANRSMFAIVDESHDLASVISFTNPISHGDRLRNASEAGFMVRTRPDAATVEAQQMNYSRFEAALESGAHFLSTDYPGSDRTIDFAIWLPEGPVMCHPDRAPAHCTTRDIETWGNYTPLGPSQGMA